MLDSVRLRIDSKCKSLSMSLHNEQKDSGLLRQTYQTVFSLNVRLKILKDLLLACVIHRPSCVTKRVGGTIIAFAFPQI